MATHAPLRLFHTATIAFLACLAACGDKDGEGVVQTDDDTGAPADDGGDDGGSTGDEGSTGGDDGGDEGDSGGDDGGDDGGDEGGDSGGDSGGGQITLEEADATYTGSFDFVALDAVADASGDGQSDLVIGAFGTSDIGVVSVLSGPLSPGTLTSSDVTAEVRGAGSELYFASGVLGVPDQDGDGYDELYILATDMDDDTQPGALARFEAPLSGTFDLEDDAVAMVESLYDGPAGRHMEAPADFDGDGVVDLIIGSEFGQGTDDSGDNWRSWIGVWAGPLTGTSTHHDDTLAMVFGGEVGAGPLSAGDLDGDGIADLVATGDHDEGEGIVVFLGPLAGEVDGRTPDLQLDFGYISELLVADLDGDGNGELVVGDDFYNGWAGTMVGRVQVFTGPLSGSETPGDAVYEVECHKDQCRLGRYGLLSEDLDDDGAADLVMTAPLIDHPYGENTGMAFVGFGPLSGSVTTEEVDVRILGGASGDVLGWEMSSGDLDGDGVLELWLGAYGSSTILGYPASSLRP